MKKSLVPTARPEITPVQTKTVTIPPASGSVATDHLAVTVTFATPAPPSQTSAQVEEDSTDVFTLERCSPLNDF
jgi:hypothetical protein